LLSLDIDAARIKRWRSEEDGLDFGKQEIILLERKLVLQNGRTGIVGEIRVPPHENLLLK
jgi:hypothetical protein